VWGPAKPTPPRGMAPPCLHRVSTAARVRRIHKLDAKRHDPRGEAGDLGSFGGMTYTHSIQEALATSAGSGSRDTRSLAASFSR
jgi:hypothetical protein